MAYLHNRPSRNRSDKDYEDMGRQLEALYDAVRPRRRVVYRTAFFKGIFAGIGGVIGATLGIALLLWILSLFSEVPLIGNFFDQAHDTIETQQR